MKLLINIKNTNVNRLEMEEIILAALEDEGYTAEILDMDGEPEKFHLQYNDFPIQLKEIMESEGYPEDAVKKVVAEAAEIYAAVKKTDSEDVLAVLKEIIQEKVN